MQVTRANPPPIADLNMDGVVNSTDSARWSDLLYSTSNASVYAGTDLDFDGLDDWNSGGADGDLFYESYNENLGLSGVGRVSSAGVANRVGYAGYQWDQTTSASHVRYRVYLPDIGRWTRRDPLGYVDGMGMTAFVACSPIVRLDFDGKRATSLVIGRGRRNCNDGEGVPNEDWWRSPGTLDPDVGFEEWCRTRDCANLNCSGNLKREAERRGADPLGATTCCNGKVLCVDCGKLRSKYPTPDRYPAKPAWGPPDLGNWNRALAMIGQCIAQHEEVHFREYSCPCSSGYCAPLPPSDGPECSEYRGHTREIACLNAALQQCGGSSRCRDMVQRALTEATNAIEHHKCGSP